MDSEFLRHYLQRNALMDYFYLINIPASFDIDLGTLEIEYFKAQRQYHPDKFVGKSADKRNEALHKSMDINEAYDVLKNPLKRAQHLLERQGIIVGTDADTVKPNNDVLMEIMELRENEPTRDMLEVLVAKSQMAVAEHYKNSKFMEMAQEVIRLGYLSKILDEKKRIVKV